MNNALEAWKNQVLDELHERDGPVLLKSKKMVNLSATEQDVQAVLDRIRADSGLNLQEYATGYIAWDDMPMECDVTDAVDMGGDGCDWYWENSNQCGYFDTETFNAASMCCACMTIPEWPPVAPPTVCDNNPNGFTDSVGDGCDWYDNNSGSCGYYDTADFKANEMCCSCGGGLLPDPEWRIDLDYAAADATGAALDAEYRDLTDRMMKVLGDWQHDRKVVDEYWWDKKFLPLLGEKEKLDEKTLRSIVSWIADGTKVKGKPIAEVFPEIKEWMLDNYDPSGETIVECFKMDQMPMLLQDTEWEGADWFDFYDCMKENAHHCDTDACIEDAANNTCWGYDTWNQDFAECFLSLGSDCEGLGVFAANQYLDGKLDPARANYDYTIPFHDTVDYYVVVYDVQAWGVQNLQAEPAPKNITLGFNFDEAEVTYFLQKEQTVWRALGADYEATWNDYMGEMMPLLQQMDEINQKYDRKFKELDEKAVVQFQSTTSDIVEWLDENFWYTEEPSWISLSAKVEKKSTNNTDYMWYAGIAGTTLALMLCASMLSSKKEEKAVKYDQVAEALVSQQ